MSFLCLQYSFSLVVLLGAWSCVFGADAPPSNCVQEQALDFFTKWRQGEPLPIALPPLTTIKLDSFSGEYAGFGIKISYETGEMLLIGVNDFTTEEFHLSTNGSIETSGTVRFPLLTVTADNYNLKGRAYVVYSIKGSGPMQVNFHDVKLVFNISLSPNGDGMEINNLNLNFSVGNVKINLDGSSWPVNKVLNAKAQSIIESYHSALVNEATDGLKRNLNKYLVNVSPEQLLSTFMSDCIIT